MQTYVLPDFDPTSTNKLGYVRPPPTGLTPPPPRLPTPPPVVPIPDIKGKGKAKAKAAVVVEEEQLLQMSNERFTVPEVIFHPSIIGASTPSRCAAGADNEQVWTKRDCQSRLRIPSGLCQSSCAACSGATSSASVGVLASLALHKDCTFPVSGRHGLTSAGNPN